MNTIKTYSIWSYGEKASFKQKKQFYDLHTVNPMSQEAEDIQVMISKKPGGELPES